MLFRLRTLRLWGPTSPFWLCVVLLLLVSALFLHETGPQRQSFFSKSTTIQWNIDQDADCPPRPAVTLVGLPASSEFAPPLSPAELLCRPLASDLSAVPKLLHQTWKSAELPSKFERWSKSCREKHHDWDWVLWTDDDNLKLVRKYFPWLEDTYLALPGNIYRADLVRNMYMYIFGGVYADLDTECLRPTSAAFQAFDIPFSGAENTTSGVNDEYISQAAVFGRMGTDESFKNSIPNAWMAASPGHPFFLMPLTSARAEIAKSRRFLHQLWYDSPSAEHMTGPIALRKSVNRYMAHGLGREAADLAAIGPFAARSGNTKQEVVLLPNHWVYPFNWNTGEGLRAICSAEQQSFDPKHCQEVLRVGHRGSISITYWSHTHRGKGSDAKNIEIISHE